MAIIAQYGPNNITVEVLDVYTTTRGKKVLVKAMNGEPFTVNTHGGPMTTNSAIVSADLLTNVRNIRQPRRGSFLAGTADNQPQAQELPTALFPVRNRAAVTSTGRGGINND